MQFDDLSKQVIGCAIEVHKTLGAGLLESTYEKCLAHELGLAGLSYTAQELLPVNYKGVVLDCGYRLDLVVENKLIVELKSVEKLQKIHEAQILTYMKLTGLRVGLLINFNETVLKNGIKRFVL
ncbi:MAG: GxxExxY protein [Methylococcales bacterium]|nr:GxxExxY protein [Methylococcales bacterium]MDD5632857.1 GxxExxY protein [Methylococcales bacterium]